MRAMLRRHSVIIAVIATAVVTASGPAVGRAVYDAVNADKVDGVHATTYQSKASARANKLVATNANGRLPNNIITKAPAAGTADRAATADHVRSFEGVVGRPCTKFGQTGTLRAEYDGVVDPSVALKCVGIVGLDENEDPLTSNNTRDNPSDIWIAPGSGGRGATGFVSISPVTDVDWYAVPGCDQAHQTTVELSHARDGAGIQVTLYPHDSEQGVTATGHNPATIGLQGGQHLLIKVTARQPTKYAVTVWTGCV